MSSASPVHSLKIGISGVRGVVGESLTPQLLVGFAQAFGSYLHGGVVVLGRDTRPSGEMVRNAVVGGLLATGCSVTDIGIAPVPTLQLAVRQLNADGGVAITASHNPQQWNALKFIRSDGIFLNSYQAEELLDIYHQRDFALASATEIGEVRTDRHAVDRHLEALLSHTPVDLIRARRPRVVVDTCNGAGAVVSERLLRALGAEVTMIHDTPDGRFPHPPEPTPAHLRELAQATRELHADLGFAQDADADRLAVVSPTLGPIGEEFTLAFAASVVVVERPGPIVTNLSTSRMVDEVGARYGCPVLRTRVGEVNVVEEMVRQRAVIGGEGNGGVVDPRGHYCRDSLAAICLILEGLAQRSSADAWVREFRPSAIVKLAVECPAAVVQRALSAVRREYAEQELDLTEGIKVLWPRDGSWLHVRPSNTEPIVRVVAEADTPADAQAKADAAAEVIGAVVG